VKRDNIIHQTSFKFLDIFSFPFINDKFLPCFKDVFNGNDIIVTMSKSDFHTSSTPPPNTLLPLLQKVKGTYLVWYEYYQILAKTHRHSLGQRVDSLFVEIIEALVTAVFLVREEKLPFVRIAIRKLDTLKILLMILWETKSLDTKKYIALSGKINEIGKMLGGWNGQLTKQNSPDRDS
jgi:hypothetical protein